MRYNILLQDLSVKLSPFSGNRKQETGNRKQETGNRKQETGNRKQETGNRKQETIVVCSFKYSFNGRQN